MRLEEAGTFRGLVTSTVFNTTRSGLPQLCVGVQVTEVWDTENNGWVERDNDEHITGYFVLFGQSGDPLLNAGQIQKVFGWSGKSFMELQKLEAVDLPVLIRTTEDTYKGRSSLKVQWIDTADADPTKTGVSTVDDKEVRELDKKYGRALRTLGASSGSPTAAAKPSASASKASSKGSSKSAPKTLQKTLVDTYELNGCSAQEAWATITKQFPDTPDDVVDEVWSKVFSDLFGDTDVDTVTNQQWAELRDDVIKELHGGNN